MSIYTFTPPVVETVDWTKGVDTQWRNGTRVEVPTSKVWRHFTPGARGQTVVRIGGVYQTVTNVTQTLMSSADTIAFPGGSGPAVFLGGHETRVTAEIAVELVAAGYTVTTVETRHPATDLYPSTSLYPGAP